MSERILLIETPCNQLDDDKVDPPIGLLSLASHLKRNGYETDVLDLSATDPDEWYGLIGRGYTILGFRTLCVSYIQTLAIRTIALNKNRGAISVAGGPQASALPELVSGDFDYVVTGEGEKSFLRLVQCKEEGALNSLPRIITGQRLLADDITFPDYSIVDIQEYTRHLNGKRAIAVLSSRGCGYDCAYCNSIIFGSHSSYRPMDEGRLKEGLKQLIEQYNIQSFKFIDDNFLGVDHEKRAERLHACLGDLNIDFRCYLRVDQVSSRVISLLKDCGCCHITFGIESGDDAVLETMNRGYNSARIIDGVNLAYDMGLTVRVCLMVGFPPLESDRTIKNTLDVLGQTRFHEYLVFPFLPYPKCDVAEFPEKYDIAYIDQDYTKYLQIGKNKKSGYVFSTHTFGPDDIQRWQQTLIRELAGKKAVWFEDSTD